MCSNMDPEAQQLFSGDWISSLFFGLIIIWLNIEESFCMISSDSMSGDVAALQHFLLP